MSPRLSIVVPFFNVEHYFAQCLESLREQSFTDYEAVLVDDGSLDGSLAIAEKYAADDPRFRIVRQENQGLGPARNTGVWETRGDFLTFLDSDDVVPPRAYERMIRSLDGTGSDIASGDARRFNDLGVRESYVHKIPFAKQRLSTHVRDFPALALDRMAWNKMYRRSFWDAQDLEFPSGLYEDYPVTIRSHVRARAVDVLAMPVYYWRERDGGEPSITQRVWELQNLRDRVASAENVLDFLHEEAPLLLPVVENHLLHIDVSAIAAALHRNEPSEHEEVLALAQRLYRRMSEDSRQALSSFERVQNNLLVRGRLDELEQLMNYRANEGTTGPVRRRGWLRSKYYAELPFWEDRSAGVPQTCYRLRSDEVGLRASVTDSRWVGDELLVECRVGVDRLPTTERSRVKVWLEQRDKPPRPWSFERFPARTRHGDSELSGVRIKIAPADLVRGSEHDDGDFWALVVEVKTDGVKARDRIRRVSSARARWGETRLVTPDIWVKPDPRPNGFGVTVRRVHDRVTSCTVNNDDFVVDGLYEPGEGGPAPVFRLHVDGGADAIETLTEEIPGQDQLRGFRARFRARDLVAHGLEDSLNERAVWLARLVVGAGEPRRLAHSSATPGASVVVGGRRLSLVPSIHGNLSLHEEYARPLISSVEVVGGDLRLRGQVDRAGQRPQSVQLRRYVTPEHRVDVEVPVTWTGMDFRLTVPIDELRSRVVDLRAQNEGKSATPWEVLFVEGDGAKGEPAILDVGTAWRLPGPTVISGQEVRVVLGRMARFGLIVD